MDGALDLTISIIACDNQGTIARSIESCAALCPQRIVVIDSGSTDRTMEICRQLGAVVIQHEWEGHVRQKQFALEQCDSSWVLCLDSDEALEPELIESIRSALNLDDSGVAGYEMNRRIYMAGRWLKHLWQPEWRLRLVRRGAARWGGYDPHDRLMVDGRIARLGGLLRHDAYDSVGDIVRSHINHGLRAAESYHQMGRRGSILKLLVGPPSSTFKQLVLRHAWLDGWLGWVGALATGMGNAAKQMQLIEYTRRPELAQQSDLPPTVPDD